MHREDGELVGFLSQESGGWQARTIFGHPLGDPGDRGEGESHLHGLGLSYLAEKWEVHDGQQWITASLVEASPSEVVVQLVDFFEHADRYGERLSLPAPVEPGRLRMV